MADRKPPRADLEVRSRADLRAWLSENHARSDAVRLIHYKKHTPHYVPFGALVSELLCWGWVDSVSGKVDDDRSSHLIAPRNPASAWSRVNKEKVAEARAAGLMMPPGEAAIAAAEANGMWSFLDDVERLEVPPDLDVALGDLRPVWDGWPPSVRRGTLEWLKTAKTDATRARRIEDIRSSAASGLRPSIFRR